MTRFAKFLTVASASVVLLAAATTAARADAIYTLTNDQCTGGCGAGPFGTINLSQNGSGNSATVTVKLTLAPGENFTSTGAGDALEFNLLNFTGPIAITGITSGFSAGPAPDTASAFGTFNFSVQCNSPIPCQGGNGPVGPLTFTVGDANGVLIGDFAKLSTGGSVAAYFAADIMGANGKTGNVGATGTPTTSQTPEPSSLMLMGTGVLGAAGFIRRRAIAARS